MRILLLIKHFDFGGAENHVCDLANELVRSGEEVWLCSGKGRQQKRLSPEVVHIPLIFSELNIVSLFFRLISLVKRENIQVIHAHQRIPIWIATVVGFVTGAKVAGTIHGTAWHDIGSSFVKRHIDGIIVISQNSYDIHQRNPQIRDKVYLLPNCFQVPAAIEVKKQQLSAIKLYYVSRQDQRHSKLLVNLINDVWPRFLVRHPGSTFHLVGDGCGCHKIGDALKYCDSTPWMESVICEGYVEDFSLIMRNADLVMGVGRVVGESLIHGIPALSIKWNHLGPLLTRDNFEELSYANYVSLDSQRPDPDTLLELLEEFIRQSVFYQEEASCLQKIVAEKYNIRDGVLKTISVYNKMTGNT